MCPGLVPCDTGKCGAFYWLCDNKHQHNLHTFLMKIKRNIVCSSLSIRTSSPVLRNCINAMPLDATAAVFIYLFIYFYLFILFFHFYFYFILFYFIIIFFFFLFYLTVPHLLDHPRLLPPAISKEMLICKKQSLTVSVHPSRYAVWPLYILQGTEVHKGYI